MKSILTTFLLVLAMFTMNAQDTAEESSAFYVATGLSIRNSSDANFTNSSFPSIEIGAMSNNIAIGVVVGRNNLAKSSASSTIDDYWYEIKSAYYFPLGAVDGYGLAGIGRYFDGSSTFIEYGVGVSRQFGNLGLFAQVSNWDGVTYLTPGISVSF